jgi:hypothetical protein
MQSLKINWLSERTAVSEFFLSWFFYNEYFLFSNNQYQHNNMLWLYLYLYSLLFPIKQKSMGKVYIPRHTIYNYRYGSTLAQRTNIAQASALCLYPIFMYRGPSHVKNNRIIY